MKKELGKISSVKFGKGGYQDAQFGIWFSFTMPGSGVGTGEGFWVSEWSEHCKWTNESRIKYFGELVMKIAKWCEEAKVGDVSELAGIPVELTFDGDDPAQSSWGNKLTDWRILTEVL